MPALGWDSRNREVRFVASWFDNKGVAVTRIVWNRGIARNAAVAGGDVIGRIEWDDGDDDTLKAPPGCTGVIRRLNRNIDYEGITSRPSEWALFLV